MGIREGEGEGEGEAKAEATAIGEVEVGGGGGGKYNPVTSSQRLSSVKKLEKIHSITKWTKTI